MVYNNPVGPQRYRIVDPNSAPAKTLAYVEVPPGKEFSPDAYLGRFVGVRATGRRLQQGVVRPIPIFLLGEAEVLNESDVLVQAPAGARSYAVPGKGLENADTEAEEEASPAQEEPAPKEKAPSAEEAGNK